MIPEGQILDGGALEIGSLLFEGIDQIDLTGPFEVFTRIPNARCRLYGSRRPRSAMRAGCCSRPTRR